MKVLNVKPGKVFKDAKNCQWYYQIIYNAEKSGSIKVVGKFLSQKDAKRAMREKVAHERKYHGLEA